MSRGDDFGEQALGYREAVEAIGEPTQEFRAGTGKTLLCAVIGLGTIAAGLYGLSRMGYGVYLKGGNLPPTSRVPGRLDWTTVGVVSTLSSLGIATGLGALYYANRLKSFRVFLCPDGFFCQTAVKTEVFPWNEIGSVEEVVTRERLPIVKGVAKYALPKVEGRTYQVRRSDGVSRHLDKDNVRNLPELAAALRGVCDERAIPWQVTEVDG